MATSKLFVVLAFSGLLCSTFARPRDDSPPWIKQHPYCPQCLQTVQRMCELNFLRSGGGPVSRSHPHCFEFTLISGEDFCQSIGNFHNCWAIKENKDAADTLVYTSRVTERTICVTLEMC